VRLVQYKGAKTQNNFQFVTLINVLGSNSNKMSANDDVGQRFICYLALEKNVESLGTEIVEQLQAYFPVTLSHLSLTSPTANSSNDEKTRLIKIGSTVVAALLVNLPLPNDAWDRSVTLDKLWPKAKNVMAEHVAHVIVSTVSATSNQETALEAAAAVTLVSAALTKTLPTTAVIWATGATITQPERFINSAKSLELRQLPTDIWVGLTWLDGMPTAKRKKTLAVLTTGLMPFVSREIEFMPSTLAPPVIADRILGASQLLIIKGPILREGETLGISNNERIRAHLADRGQRPNVPVYQLNVEQLDQQNHSEYSTPRNRGT
jgi:hypothetical protein